MIRAVRLKLPLFCPVLIVAGCLVSCDTPQKKALRELSKIGVQPSGVALLEAVEKRDMRQTGWLLDVGVYTEQRDDKGRTPARVALENGDVGTVFKLLEAKANVNATTPDQVSLLGKAVEGGETAIVEKLLETGARSDGLMPDGDKILPWAIRNGRLSFVRAMMKAGADPHLKDSAGNPLLHVAMETKRRDLTDSLIDLGADATATNAAGESTVQLAVRNGWLDAVPKLAKAGADVDSPCMDGATLLERAISSKDREQVVMLLKLGANPNRPTSSGDKGHQGNKGGTPLERVFNSGDAEFFGIFLAQGAKPAEGKWDGWLWKAFARRDLDRARVLLARGAKANATGPHGYNLVETATLAREGSFLKLLTDYGSPAGDALYFASARGDLEMTSLLISFGVPANATRLPTLDTPLGAAIRGKHDNVAAFLLQNGADPTLQLPEGQPILHCAIATGCHLTVKGLLERGADPNEVFTLPINQAYRAIVRPGVMRWVLKNDLNATPLMLAADSGVVQTARYLIRAGAKMQVRTKSTSLWPINFASRRSDVKMMRLFLGRDPQNEERRIVIRLSEQRAQMFDSQGKEIFATKVSTGKKGHDTPTGEYVITNKYRDWKSTLYHASMPYFQRLNCGDFGLHQGVVPNYPASHGCIRVPAGNAEKLFAMTQAGDRVNIIP